MITIDLLAELSRNSKPTFNNLNKIMALKNIGLYSNISNTVKKLGYHGQQENWYIYNINNYHVPIRPHCFFHWEF